MIVYTTGKSIISLTGKAGGNLIDSDGVEWVRDPEFDSQDPFKVGYRETKANISVIQLTRYEINRVIKGEKAMNTPMTVLEMRYRAVKFRKELRGVIDMWPDQKLRELLIKADESGKDPTTLMEDAAYDEAFPEPQVKDELKEEPQERPKEATKRHVQRGTGSRIPRHHKQEGSVSVALEEVSVLLTPKQLEFMERLSECPGWKEHTVKGEYVASDYAQELSDTMTAMSVGAVLTTLREKSILRTEKRKVGATKFCTFQLTDLGVQVYNKLAEGVTGNAKIKG